MIITLSKANFSASNIGTLSTWRITKDFGGGVTLTSPATLDSIDRKGTTSTAVTLTVDTENYTLGTTTITMGTTDVTTAWGLTTSGNTITFTIPAGNTITSNITIKVTTINNSTGEEDEPETPDVGGGDDNSGGATTPTAGKNLFNENDPDYLPEYRLSPSTGKPSTDQDVGNWFTSGYIAVTPGTNYVASGELKSNGNRGNCTAGSRWYFFDSDKTFLGKDTGGYFFNDGATYRTAPEGAAYVRVSISKSIYVKPQLEIGTEHTAYEEYKG